MALPDVSWMEESGLVGVGIVIAVLVVILTSSCEVRIHIESVPSTEVRP